MILNKNFYQNGFKTISPDLPKFNTDGTITITFTYEPSSQQKIFLYIILALLRNKLNMLNWHAMLIKGDNID